MKRRVAGLVALVALTAVQTVCPAPSFTRQQQKKREFSQSDAVVPGVVIVKFRAGHVPAAGTQSQSVSPDPLLRQVGVRTLSRVFPVMRLKKTGVDSSSSVDLSGIYYAVIDNSMNPRGVASSLSGLAEVEYAEPKFLSYLNDIPNDSLLNLQTNALTRINAFSGWTLAKGDSTVVIATVDGGTYWGHQDLLPNLWINPGEDLNHNGRFDPLPVAQGGDLNGLDNDGNGYVGDVVGWNFANNSNDPRGLTPENADHGTSTASVFGARTNNRVGMAGSSWNCRLMPVCASGTTDGSIAFGFEGIMYAANNGAKVINCSWGRTGGYSLFEQDVINAVTASGVLVVVSAGNGNNNNGLSKSNDLLPDYPANYSHVLPVGATFPTSDTFASFSNYGLTVPVYAPGVNIVGATNSGAYTSLNSGTSFATPLVAGLAGILRSLHPAWTPEQIAAQIRVTSDPIDGSNPALAGQLGHGRVNFARAFSEQHPGITVVSSSFLTRKGSSIFLPGDTVIATFAMKNVLPVDATNLSVSLSSLDPSLQILQGTANLGTLAQGAQTPVPPLSMRVGSLSASKNIVVKLGWISNGSDQDATAFRVTVFTVVPQWLQQSSPTQLGLASVKAVSQKIAWAAGGDGNGTPVVVRTTDGGTQWSDVTGNLSPVDLYCVSGLDQNKAWVGTGNGRIYATVDGGATWVQQSYPAPQSPFIDGVLFPDPNIGYALGDPPSPSTRWVVLKTTNGGQTWTHLANEPVGVSGEAGWNNSFWWTDVNHGWFGSNKNKIWRTTDGGATWSSSPSNSTDSYAVAFKDNSFGVAGHSDGVVSISSDGGASWRSVATLPLGIGGAAFVQNSNFAWISTGSFPYKSTDNGATWTPQSVFPVSGFILHISVADTGSGWQTTDFGEILAYKPGGLVGVRQDANGSLPGDYELLQNFPNPFNPTTSIAFRLPISGHVKLTVVDLLGREVATLVDDYQQAGEHTVQFGGHGLSSGMYIYRLSAGTVVKARKLLLLK